MREVMKWAGIWFVLGGSIAVAVNGPALDLGLSGRQTPAKVLVADVEAAAPDPSSTPTAAAVAQTPSPVVGRFVVGKTDGVGAYIRRTPTDSDKIKPWRDGTEMFEVGPLQEVRGLTWRNVRDPSGNTGWIPDRYLVPVSGAAPTVSPSPSPVSTPATVQGSRQLELLSGKMTMGYGYSLIEGQVKNITDRNLDNVVVVITWRGADRAVVQTDEEFIQANPLLPGMTSGFKVVRGLSAGIATHTIGFRELSGGLIPTIDSRSGKAGG